MSQGVFSSVPASQAPSETKRIIVLLEELLATVWHHFEHEEALMIRNNFTGLISHKRDHDYLIKNLFHFTSALSHGMLPF
jgi:hemerythrin